MQITIMRHGEASMHANSDAERPLTSIGEAQSQQMASMLVKQTEPFDLVLVSPYLRAQQTWQSMRTLLPSAREVMTCEDITPYGDSSRAAEYIRALVEVHGYKSILVVSHLPLVGYMCTEFLPGSQPPMFLTGAAAVIDYDLDSGKASLLESLVPGIH